MPQARYRCYAPDVNESGVSFIVTPKGIRFGLSAIKNVGTGAVEQIVKGEARKADSKIFLISAFVSIYGWQIRKRLKDSFSQGIRLSPQ